MAHDNIEYPKVQTDDTVYSFTSEELAEIERHASKYPSRQSAVMPALWIAQEKWGWLSNGAMQLVADTLGLSFAHVYGVATFYTMYLKENKATHLLEICTCFTCGECNGDNLYKKALKMVNADENGVSADKKIWLREAECLGACDTAPVAQINNGHILNNLDEAKLEKIIQDLQAGNPIAYEQVPLIDQRNIG